MYSEGDDATFSAVYTCSVAIEYQIKNLDRYVMDELQISDDKITDMTTLIQHLFSKIYSGAHVLALATDQLLSMMQSSILYKFGKEIVQLGNDSINQQYNMAILRLSMRNEGLCISMLVQFAAFLIRQNIETMVLMM